MRATVMLRRQMMGDNRVRFTDAADPDSAVSQFERMSVIPQAR